MRVLNKQKLNEAFDILNRESELYLPTARKGQSGFTPWKSYDKANDQIMLEAVNVYGSAKEILFPQTERMYSFRTNGDAVEVITSFEDTQPRIIFGLRACDLAAISCLDDVFLTRGYEDSYYQARRDNVTLIVNACYQPGPNCLCNAMGVDCVNPVGADVIIRDAGDVYVWEAQNPKGEAATAMIASLLEDREVGLPSLKPFAKEVNFAGVTEKLAGMFEHPIWEELSPTCQNCGICTYVCPTCHCFDIQVKTYGEEGFRYRCYDSCMYGEYSLMAGGHNPRPTGLERFRQRFLHKLEFFSERYGKSLCIGCGRCVVACPAGINITEIIQKIQEVDSNA